MNGRTLALAALLAFAALAIAFPLLTDDRYLLRIGSMIFIYWTLIAGLNLLVGYTGLLSIGHVGLLAIGGYCFTILAGRYGVDPFLALAAGGGLSALCGLLLGLPSFRLPGFYFALATIAFGLIVAELALAFSDVTGGTVGLAVPRFSDPVRSIAGQYWFVLAVSAAVTWLTWNLSRMMWGRSLIAIRDSDVAARSVAVPVFRAKLLVFVFSGAAAGVAGGLFARAQSHITPEAFNFDLSLYFFVAIIIGGRGSIVGPFIGTVLLALLPDLFGSLQRYTAFFYGAALLAVVLTMPEGVGALIRGAVDRFRPAPLGHGVLRPDPAALTEAIKGGSR